MFTVAFQWEQDDKFVMVIHQEHPYQSAIMGEATEVGGWNVFVYVGVLQQGPSNTH